MKFKNIIKLSLTATLLLSFIACDDNEENKPKANLLKPNTLQQIRDLELNLVSTWYSADHDPSSATKIGFAYSEELKDYEKAIEWYKYSNSMQPSGANSNYACYAYQQLKKFEDAISWCKQAIELGENEGLIGLGYSYSNLKNYNESIKWYLEALKKNHPDAMINLGTTYKNSGDYKNSELYYKKAIQKNDYDAYQGIAKLYHDNLKDDVKASAYAIAVINTAFSKSSVIKLLKDTWQIPIETIKKGYELQLNSPDFLIKYEGDLGLW